MRAKYAAQIRVGINIARHDILARQPGGIPITLGPYLASDLSRRAYERTLTKEVLRVATRIQQKLASPEAQKMIFGEPDA